MAEMLDSMNNDVSPQRDAMPLAGPCLLQCLGVVRQRFRLTTNPRNALAGIPLAFPSIGFGTNTARPASIHPSAADPMPRPDTISPGKQPVFAGADANHARVEPAPPFAIDPVAPFETNGTVVTTATSVEGTLFQFAGSVEDSPVPGVFVATGEKAGIVDGLESAEDGALTGAGRIPDTTTEDGLPVTSRSSGPFGAGLAAEAESIALATNAGFTPLALPAGSPHFPQGEALFAGGSVPSRLCSKSGTVPPTSAAPRTVCQFADHFATN